ARFATDRIIVISQQQFKEIQGDFGIGRAKQFTVIPLGIDLEPFGEATNERDAIRSELYAVDNQILVGFVGRLTEIKNISLLFQAAERYFAGSDTELPKLSFVVVGDGHLREPLEAEVEQRSLNNKVAFLGNRTDIEAIYAGLDIVALTSLNEGTPLSLIEAMASGRPVISTAVGGVIDLLGEVLETHDGFNVCERGIGVMPISGQGFLNGLIYLIKNEKLRESIIANAREFVRATYSKDRLVNDVRELYRELVR
ncbi:MAG: glycosyltransferase family 4 protein, partial [Pyrinomonadaceae bacterium]